jgi:hypothetical protein
MSACTASPEPWKPLNAASGSRAAEESASAAFFKTLRSAPRARRSACARPAASESSADSGTADRRLRPARRGCGRCGGGCAAQVEAQDVDVEEARGVRAQDEVKAGCSDITRK